MDEIIPLCRHCHDALDRRNGVSDFAATQTEIVREMVVMRRPAWLRRWT